MMFNFQVRNGIIEGYRMEACDGKIVTVDNPFAQATEPYRRRATQIMRNFCEHEATHLSKTSLLWRRPESSTYLQKFSVDGAYLSVTGDTGCAIYRWSDKVTLEWISNLGLSYFAEKCCASPRGVPCRSWSESCAIHSLEGILEGKKLEAALMHVQYRDVWNEYCHIYHPNDDLYDIGMCIDLACQSHLMGLYMAQAYLKAKSGTEVRPA